MDWVLDSTMDTKWIFNYQLVNGDFNTDLFTYLQVNISIVS